MKGAFTRYNIFRIDTNKCYQFKLIFIWKSISCMKKMNSRENYVSGGMILVNLQKKSPACTVLLLYLTVVVTYITV